MDIDIIELSERKARFVLSGVSASFANALRRSILAEVPVLAIDDVNIYENTSVLFDEQLSLRLGMIPLKTDSKSFSLPAECTCKGEGCPSCQVSFTLSAEGKDGPKVVYSGDMVPTDPKVVPADTTIPIVELKEKHKVVVEAIARLGTGRNHCKWQAGVASGYKNMPVVTIGDCDSCGKCVEVCPRQLLKLNGSKAKVKDIIECSMCRLCEEACDMDSIKVSSDPESFVMTFETTGALPASELTLLAADSIKKRAAQLTEIIGAL